MRDLKQDRNSYIQGLYGLARKIYKPIASTRVDVRNLLVYPYFWLANLAI